MGLWQESPSIVQMPGGESLVALQTRLRGAFDALADGGAEGQIVVVTHGFAILSLLTHLLGIELDSFRRLWIDPTGISRVERRGGRWVVRCINDTGHLGS
jgi:broad specificity phosphatase PhoE